MKKVIFIFLYIFLAHITINAGKTPALTIARSYKAIKPDGDASDWGTSWITFNKGLNTNTTSAVTAKFQMTFNDDYLWIITQVNGDVSVDTSSVAIPLVSETDGIDIFLKMDTLSGNGSYREGDLHLRMKRGSIFPDGFTDLTPGVKLLIDNDFKIGQTDTNSLYTQEWQIPWGSMCSTMKDSGTFSPSTYGYMAFDIEVTDNTTGFDGGVTQQLFWQYPNIESWRNTNYWAIIQFAERSKKAANSNCKNFFAIETAKNNKLKISPNPVKDQLNINSTNPGEILIQLFDINGELKLEKFIREPEVQLNVSKLASGLYFVKVIGATSEIFKIVKE